MARLLVTGTAVAFSRMFLLCGTAAGSVILQDGNSYFGLSSAPSKPIEGEQVSYVTHNTWPSGWTGCTNACFDSQIVIEDYVWMTPYLNTNGQVVKVHKNTGVMTGYNGWPGAVSLSTLQFNGAAFDIATRLLWMFPYQASHYVSVNVDTGSMGYCANWPAGYAPPSYKGWGGFFEGGKYLWHAPLSATMFPRLDVSDCSATPFTNTPGGFSWGGTFAFFGAVFDGSRGWFIAAEASHIVRMNVGTGAVDGYQTWPSGWSAGAGQKFAGGTFDGQNVWLAPRHFNMVVAADKDTGAMTGYNAWPSGFSAGSVAFGSAAYDGKYVWLPPFYASHMIRIDVSTGNLMGFNNWPSGWGRAMSVALDMTTGSLWVAGSLTPNLIQIVIAPTPTVEATPTSQVILQNGNSYGGPADTAPNPLHGDTLRQVAFHTAPAGYTSGTFNGLVVLGDYIWMTPFTATVVTKIHTATGVATAYSTGWTFSKTTSNAFAGCIFHPPTNLIFMVPLHSGMHLSFVDTTSGAIGGYPWSHGDQFQGGCAHKDYVWVAGYVNGRPIVRVKATDGTSTAFNTWPSGFSPGSGGWIKPFNGMISDGLQYGWLPPHTCNMAVRVDLDTGDMIGHGTFPGGYVGGTAQFKNQVFDGHNIWLAPREANMIISVDQHSGFMTGFNNYPSVMSNAGTELFYSAAYDGFYVWFLPRTGSHIIRLQKDTGMMTPFDRVYTNPVEGAVDMATSSLWIMNPSGYGLTRLTFFSATATETKSSEATKTQYQYLQQGSSTYRYEKALVPLAKDVQSIKHDSFPVGWVPSTYACGVMVYDGAYMWAVPYFSSHLLRIHPSGTMQGFNAWPTGDGWVDPGAGQGKFYAGGFDGRYLYMLPYHSNGIARVDTDPSNLGVMNAYVSFPGITLGTSWFWSGIVFLPDGHVICSPGKASHVMKMNPNTGGIDIYNTWPGSLSLSSTIRFDSIYYTGTKVWLQPLHTNMFVEMATDGTGAMVGHNSWPAGFTLGATPFGGGIYDQVQFIYSCPRDANGILRVDVVTGLMGVILTSTFPAGYTGTSTTKYGQMAYDGQSLYLTPRSANFPVRVDLKTNEITQFGKWPSGFTPGSDMFLGVGFDGTSLWLAPSMASSIVQFRSTTYSSTGTASAEATGTNSFPTTLSSSKSQSEEITQTSSLRAHDGHSWSIERYAPNPMDGPDFQMHAFDNWGSAGGYAKASGDRFWSLLIGDYFWMIPRTQNARLTKMHVQTGQMTRYTSMPAGFSWGTDHYFYSCAYDGTRLWMIAACANQMVGVDPNTGSMIGYPHGFVPNFAYDGATVVEGFLWATPRATSSVLRMDTSNGAMTSWSSWPTGFSWFAYAVQGAAFDGTYHWMFLSKGGWVIGVRVADGTMTGLSSATWGGGITFPSTNRFQGIHTEGENLYLIPADSNSLVHLNSVTNAAVGYQNWPAGMTLMNGLFGGGVFDGQFIWMPPRSTNNMLVRFNTLTSTMRGFTMWPLGFVSGTWPFMGLAFDPRTKSLWLPPGNANMVIRVSCTTFTQTASQSDENTKTSFLRIGDSSSNSIVQYAPMPFQGPDYEFSAYSNWASAGITKTTSHMYYSQLVVEGHMWMFPEAAAVKPTKVNLATGVMTEYPSMPGGYSAHGNANYASVVFDGTYIWMVPYHANMFVRILPSTGAMAGWSAGCSGGAGCWQGTTFGHGYVWATGQSKNGFLRLDSAGSTSTFNSWPSGYSWATAYLSGGAFDGLYHWAAPKHGRWVIGINTKTTDIVGFNSAAASWAASITFVATFNSYGAVHAGHSNLWIIPCYLNSFVHLDTDTGVALGYNSWPTGYTPTPSTTTASFGIFDGLYLWSIAQQLSPSLFRLDTRTGSMILMSFTARLSGFGYVPGGDPMSGLALDPDTKSLLWAPRTANLIVRMRCTTFTATDSPTKEPTPTMVLTVHDGSSSTSVTYLGSDPLSGPDYQIHGYDDWSSAGITKTTSIAYYSAVIVGDYVWLCPFTATARPTKVHKVTGAMTQHPTWPGGFVSNGGNFNGAGIIYDGTSLWLVPYEANMVVQIDPTNGAMVGHTGFPGGVSGTNRYFGGTYDNNGYVWMQGQLATHVARVAISDGSMLGFSTWPTGFVWQNMPCRGATFDGAYVWGAPFHYSWVVGVNTQDGTMKGWDVSTWMGAGINYHTASRSQATISTGANTLFVLPCKGDSIVSLNTLSGIPTAFNAWPAGFTFVMASECLFSGGIYDGHYLWGSSKGFIIRFDSHSGVMANLKSTLFPAALTNSNSLQGMTFDPVARSLWFIPYQANMMLRVTANTFTETDTDTLTPAPSASATRTATVSPVPTPSHMATPSRESTETKSKSTSLIQPETPAPATRTPTTRAAAAPPTTTAAPTTTTVAPPTASTPSPPTTTTTTAPSQQVHFLSVVAVEADHWVGSFSLSSNATTGQAQDVTLSIAVQAAVILSVSSNSSFCASASTGRSSEVLCSIPSIAAGTSVQIFVLVNSSLSYQFNGAVILRYTANASNAQGALSGKLKLMPIQANSPGGNQATSSPTGTTGQGNSKRGVFGQGDGIGRCIDAFVFTSLGSIVLVLVMLLAAVAYFSKKEEQNRYSSQRTKKKNEGYHEKKEEEGGDLDKHTEEGGGDSGTNPNTWKAIPLWRSLIVQHAYCIVPCHSQCALNHTLPLVAHVFTLMMLCATISSTFLTSDVSAVAVTVVLSILVAAGLRPLVVNTYYFRFTWAEESIRKTAITSNRSKTSSNENLKTRLQLSRLSGVVSPPIQASMVALDNVELEEGHGGEAAGGGTITTLNGTGTELEPLEGTQSSVEDEEKETGKEAEEELDQEEEGEKDFEDDVVHLEQKKEPEELKRQEESKESNDHEHQQQQHLVGGTIHKLAKETDFNEGEEELEKEEEEEARKRSSRSDVVSIQSCSSNEDGLWRVKMIVTPHRKRGHYLVCTVLALVAVIALSVILTIETSSSCSMFETSFLTALLVDLVVVQPLIVAFTWMYRWLQSDEENNLWSELHPFDGAERDV